MRDRHYTNKYQIFLAVFISLFANTFAQTLIWSDEFEGSSLDLSKWIVIDAQDWWDCWYAPHNVEVSGGTLKLHSAEESYNGMHWTGAKLEGKYHPQYKYLEARIRHSAPDTKIWATWWTIGWQNNTWQWPPELDICEFGTQWEPNPSQTYHWDTGGGHLYDGSNTGVDETQWHTYGVYWSASQSPIFYVNGLISYAPSGPIEGFLMEALLILTSSPNRDDHYSGCPLAVWEVDYVRVYDAPPVQPVTATHLAYQKPADASTQENSGLGADKAVDGIDSSRWASAWSDPQWLRVDLGDVYPVNQVKIYWEYASAREYKVQVSDSPDGPWTDCVHITNNLTHQGWKIHNFPAQTGRYLRVYCIQRTTEWGYSIFELEVYQDCRGADIDHSGMVEMEDMEALVSYWLESNCALYNDCDGADLHDDNQINILDFEIAAGTWLRSSCSVQ
jgi:beta-glucanase (GH16 family)